MRLAISAAAVAAAFLAIPVAANAQAIIDITQDGSNVVATLSGSVNTSGLTFLGNSTSTGNGIIPSEQLLYFNTNIDGEPGEAYTGFTGPANFGSGGYTPGSSDVGDLFVIESGLLAVPMGYTSGSALSATEVFDNTTLAGLGATPGIYDYTWTGGFVQIDIGQDVPEPAALSLMAVGVAMVGVIGRRRSRQAAV